MKQWEFEKLTKLNSLEDIEEIEKAMRKLDIEISILLEVHIRYEELKEMKKRLKKNIVSINWES